MSGATTVLNNEGIITHPPLRIEELD